MDIAATSSALRASEISNSSQVKVFKSAQDQQEQVVTKLIDSINQAPAPAENGGRLNVVA